MDIFKLNLVYKGKNEVNTSFWELCGEVARIVKEHVRSKNHFGIVFEDKKFINNYCICCLTYVKEENKKNLENSVCLFHKKIVIPKSSITKVVREGNLPEEDVGSRPTAIR